MLENSTPNISLHFFHIIENQHQIHKTKQKQPKAQKEKKENMMSLAANHNDSLNLSNYKNSEKVRLNSFNSSKSNNDINDDYCSIEKIGKKRIRNKFTPEEDQKLRELIQKHGVHSWNLVSSLMENRNQRQCRERWKHYLSCDMKEATKPWTKEEDSILINKYNELGAKWTKIALELPGRTDLQVKIRYLKNLKNKKNRHKFDSDETESNDEALPDNVPDIKEDSKSEKTEENKKHEEIYHNIDTEFIEKAFADLPQTCEPTQQEHHHTGQLNQELQPVLADITLGKPNDDNNNNNNSLDLSFDFNVPPSNLITEIFHYNNGGFLSNGFEPEFFHWGFE